MVHDPDSCVRCGDLGHYFLINPNDPGDIFTIDCTERSCANPPRDGIPDPTPNDVVTEPIVVTHDGVRGICYGRNGLVRTGDSISGTIDVGCPPRKKMP